jgi:hypothetical protein
MRILLYSGLLYLLGVGIVLAIKPALMFADDGAWKEFGLGRNPERYTWLPFWLFAVLWAILSFFSIQLLATLGVLPGVEWTQIETVSSSPASISAEEVPRPKARSKAGPPELKPGYYMLNTEGTAKEGMPKYIYIGPAPESD